MLLFTSCWSAVFGETLGVELAVVRGEALAGGQLELPAMHGTGEDAVLYLAKTCKIGLEMWTAALDAVAIALPELLLRRLFSIVAFDILDALGREALEENVDVFVIRSLALCFEATGEEEIVDPVLDVTDDAGFDESRVNLEAVFPLFIVPWVDLTLLEIHDHRLLSTVDEEAPVDADAGEIGVFQ